MKARCTAPVEYEMVDHTADLGIIVRGCNLADLFARAGAALADLQYDPSTVRETSHREVRLEEPDQEVLLVRFLNELIVLREVEDFLWRVVEVDMDEKGRLHACLTGERFDEARHSPRTGLKAATYHQLRVEPGAGGMGQAARIILDV